MMEELEGMPKKAPDLLIYLDGSFETILDHIRKRGREFEQIEDDSELLAYYELLFKNYEQWYQEYDQSPKIKINIDTYDIVNNSVDEEQVMAIIEKALLDVRGEEAELTYAGSNIG
jgi:deoxyadenosine/deoxycytidine kinase